MSFYAILQDKLFVKFVFSFDVMHYQYYGMQKIKMNKLHLIMLL